MKALRTAAASAMVLAGLAGPGMAEGDSVRWKTIVGIAQPGNVAAGISGGGQPWSTLNGEVHVDLRNSMIEFEVRGLVLGGGNAIGTIDGITQVKGTLICGPASATPVVIDTPLVTLSPQGDAEFEGALTSSSAACSATDVAFLIRISANRWIAYGAVRVP